MTRTSPSGPPFLREPVGACIECGATAPAGRDRRCRDCYRRHLLAEDVTPPASWVACNLCGGLLGRHAVTCPSTNPQETYP